jgi:hypothetical protein
MYIGKHQTDNLDDGYMGSGILVKRAQEKHGIDSFEKTILYVFNNEEEMNAKEAELVTEEFCSRDDTYNLCPGGKGGWGYINQNGLGIPISEQRKRNPDIQRQLSVKGGKITGGKNWLNSTRFENKSHSDETKRKIGEANSIKQSGKNNSQYGLQWITNGIESKKIRKDDLIPEGWRKGRKIK